MRAAFLAPILAASLPFAGGGGCRPAAEPGDAVPAQPRPRVVVVTHGQAADPFWSVVKRGVDAAGEDMGAQVDYRAPEHFDVVRMAQLLDAAVAAKPSGIALTLPDADALAAGIRRAREAGIPIVSFNSGSGQRAAHGIALHVGQDEREAGRRAGARLAEAGVEVALCVNHEVGNVALDRRCEGFAEGLGGEVEVLGVDLDPTKTEARVYAALEANPKVQAILTLGPLAAMPTLAAVERKDREEKLRVATFDLSPEVLDAVEAGRLEFALDQQPYLQGYLPVVLLVQQFRTGAFPASDILTGPSFVGRQDVAGVREGAAAGLR